MANTFFPLSRRFVAFSDAAKQQTDKDTPLANSDIDTRDKCTVEVTDTINKIVDRDCENVFVDNITARNAYKIFRFVYPSVSPQILARWAAYYFGATAAPTGTNENEVQTLARTGTVSGGTFTLQLSLEGRTGTTRAIAFDASLAEIKAALTKKGTSIENLIKDGDITVTGDWTAGIVITFAGRLAGADLPLLVVNAASLTGTTPNISVTETAAGDAKYFPFVRATSEEKPLFSFALGDKTGTLATEKYYNCVCSSFVPTANRDGNVGLTVTVLANFDPDDVVSFPVPDCINYKPLPVSDCRVSVGGNWETLDLFTETITLDDGVTPDFGFDSFAPDTYYRSEEVNYPITGQIFGVKSDPFGQLAYNRGEAEMITHFGQPGNRFSVIAPRVIFDEAKRTFVGTPTREAIDFTAVAARDGVNNPIKAEAYLSQTTAYLLT